jgi:prolyl-tRNA editing enzyme YbaK/EbsC (Cys-tRNA(Pro) deacylase)
LTLPAATSRFVVAAAELGVAVEPVVYPEGTKTASAAAAAIGCDVAQIVKSLVFMAGDNPVVVLVAGDRRVDLSKVAAILESDEVRRASLEEVRAATGFVAGGTPPFGHVQPLRVLADVSLGRHEALWAAAGTPTTVFPITGSTLARVSAAKWEDLAEEG